MRSTEQEVSDNWNRIEM